jgi:SNF2 family DNA or RNA helicase
MKYKFKTKPYKHQVAEIKKMFARGYGGGLLWQPGTGKTKTIIDWSNILHMKGELNRLMVVCPLSVVGVWGEQIEEHSPLWDSGDLMIVEYEKDMDEIDEYKGGLTICILNYDIMWRRDEVVEAFRPQGLVVDESHRIKKPSAKRSMYVRRFNKLDYRSILTGTPIPRNFYDIYGQWVFLNKKTFGTRGDEFKDRYMVFNERYAYKKKQAYKELRGYRHVKELNRKIRSDATTLTKEECLDLPPELYQRVPVYLEPKVMEMYQRLAKEYFLELEDGAIVDVKNVLGKISKLQQIAGGQIITEQGLREISQAKIKTLTDLLYDRFDIGKKVVIFARFRGEIEAIRRVCIDRYRVPTYLIMGGIKQKDRDNARRMFQALEGPSAFIAQIQSGGLGITLHSSHEAIFYSVTHALDDYVQARGRLHRSGQKFAVTYRHLTAIDTVDEDIYAALRAKQKIEDLIMKDPKRLLRNGGKRDRSRGAR